MFGVKVYGAETCADTRHAREFLDRLGVRDVLARHGLLERVEIDHDHIDGLDVVLGHVRESARTGAPVDVQ